MKTSVILLSAFCSLFVFVSCSKAQSSSKLNLRTVEQLDLDRYLGKWYEIARYDHSFERGLEACTAEYSLRPDNKIRVVNSGYNAKKNQFKTSVGKAIRPNPELEPGKLKVSFFLWFYGDYNVLELDQENYSYVLIGSSTDNYLWILSRTPVMSDADKSLLTERASQRGYDISRLIWVNQDINLRKK